MSDERGVVDVVLMGARVLQHECDTDQWRMWPHVLQNLCYAGLGKAHGGGKCRMDSCVVGVPVCDVSRGDEGAGQTWTANMGEHAIQGGRLDGQVDISDVQAGEEAGGRD